MKLIDMYIFFKTKGFIFMNKDQKINTNDCDEIRGGLFVCLYFYFTGNKVYEENKIKVT